LLNVNIDKYRYALTILRVSSHCLEVERGRWHKPNKIPFENSKCQYCNVLEDEFHFIFECPMYNNISHIYLQDYLDNGNSANIPILINLFQSTDKNVNRNLSTFTYKAFEIRNQYYMYYVN